MILRQDILESSQSTEITSALFSNYSYNVKYNLEQGNKMPEPK